MGPRDTRWPLTVGVIAVAALCVAGWTMSGCADSDREERRAGAEGAAQPDITGGRKEVVEPVAETQPVPHSEDAADDPAIWVDPVQPSRSVIIGTDKRGGIAVYDLAGNKVQYRSDGEINNVDLQEAFALGGRRITLVTAGNWTDNTLETYRLVESTHKLVDVAGSTIEPSLSINGSCMYRSPRTGSFYAFVNSQSGDVEQWELFDDGTGRVGGRRVRSFAVGDSEIEGCVADHERARLYVAEEDRGLWSYWAEPDAGDRRRLVDSAGDNGHLVADVEGLAIADAGHGSGYLIASSQGDNSFSVYRREGANEYVKSFRIGRGDGIDGVDDTDGIEVTTAPLGPRFPTGVFVVQDGTNDKGNQNFKLVPWEAIRP